MTILSNVNYFKELPFFNVSIETPKIKCLKNVDLLAELPFYDQLSIINNRYNIDQSFQEILYRIDAWINKGSGWIIESIESQYIISTHRP